jgi:hypothetical protein
MTCGHKGHLKHRHGADTFFTIAPAYCSYTEGYDGAKTTLATNIDATTVQNLDLLCPLAKAPYSRDFLMEASRMQDIEKKIMFNTAASFKFNAGRELVLTYKQYTACAVAHQYHGLGSRTSQIAEHSICPI